MAIERLILDRLMFAKYVLATSQRELAAGTEMSAWISVLLLHDATETFLLAVADHLGIERKFRGITDYPSLFSQHLKSQPKAPQLQHSQVLRELNDLRDPTKHRGIYPRRQHVREVSNHLHAFFEDNAQEFFGVSFDALSLAEMIVDERIKREVKLAEEHLQKGAYTPALSALATAFLIIVGNERNRFSTVVTGIDEQPLPYDLIKREDVASLSSPGQRAGVGSVVEKVNTTWRAVVERLQALEIGLNPVEYATFKSIVPVVRLTDGGVAHVTLRADEPLLHTRENAEFCFQFVLEAIGRIQSAPRLKGSRGEFKIRAREDTPYYKYPDISKPAAQLAKGTEIGKATFAKGSPYMTGDAWGWTNDAGEYCFAALEAFDEVPD